MPEAVDQTDRLRLARAALAQVEARQNMRSATADSGVEGGLGKGTYHLDGTIQTLAATLSQLMSPEQYVAVVGVSDVAWEGVAKLGVPLSHVVVVRSTADQGPKVIGNLLEGFNLVVVGSIEMAPRMQRALAARSRKLGATLLTMQPWPGVTSDLPQRWGLNVEGDSLEVQELPENPLLRYRSRVS